MYYLLLLAGIGGSQESKRPKRETAIHVVKGLLEGIELYHAGPRLRCLIFNHWIAALRVLWVQCDSSIILVSTSCEACSHP